jgi:HK97 family phage portal protein
MEVGGKRQLFYRVIGGDSVNAGEDAYLLPQDVYHIRNFHTRDGLTGEGVVSYGADTLGISLGADKFANSLFANGGMPAGILEVPGGLDPEAIERIGETWKAAHGGRKVGGTAVLEEGAKFSPITHDPQVLQFLESRKFSVLEIARFLRVPPTKLYDAETSTYNNIEHENLAVATDTLDAWSRMFEMEADIKLLNKSYGGLKTEMDISAIFRGDMETRAKYFTALMQNAAMTPNEIRRKEGFEPYAGGDEYYIASNNFTPVSRIDEVIDSQIKAKETPAPEKQEPEKEEDNGEKEVNMAVGEYFKSKTK